MATFKEFDLLDSLKGTLAAQNIAKPTDIQARMIPLFLDGHSAVGVAQTGSGKTLAYVLPILNLLKRLENAGERITEPGQPRAAVLVPSRELGEQVSQVFKKFTHDTRLRVRTVLGGAALKVSKANVQVPFEVLVATPGRLAQLMARDLVNLTDVRILIFDEADQMLDPSFLDEARSFAAVCPSAQLGLFSATISSKVEALIQSLFSKAKVVRGERSNHLVETLTTKSFFVENGHRFPFLEKELTKPSNKGTLIFVNTRSQCDEVARQLKEIKQAHVVYRGEMDKKERRANLKDFREGKVDVLISTDLASRGLDVERVSRVINYHLPKTIENYVHRVGRTARAGRKGLVVNLVTRRDKHLMDQVTSKLTS